MKEVCLQMRTNSDFRRSETLIPLSLLLWVSVLFPVAIFRPFWGVCVCVRARVFTVFSDFEVLVWRVFLALTKKCKARGYQGSGPTTQRNASKRRRQREPKEYCNNPFLSGPLDRLNALSL